MGKLQVSGQDPQFCVTGTGESTVCEVAGYGLCTQRRQGLGVCAAAAFETEQGLCTAGHLSSPALLISSAAFSTLEGCSPHRELLTLLLLPISTKKEKKKEEEKKRLTKK